MTDLAPVAVFVYKRLDKTKKCLKALEGNIGAKKTDVFIFSDGAKGEMDEPEVVKVRTFLDDYKENQPFRSFNICKRQYNLGLATSIITGVTEVINQFGRVIVVEDDLVTAQDFLLFLNRALEYYDENKQIGEISAYTYPLKGLERYENDIYVTRKADCWGWATWKDRWNLADWEMKSYLEFKERKLDREFEKLQKGICRMLCRQMEGKLDSWAVRWCYSLFINEKLTVYPKISRTVNIGFDGSGVHCGVADIYGKQLSNGCCTCEFKNLDVNKELEKEAAFFEHVPWNNKIANFLKRRIQNYGREN